jgi:hypothetical protein
MIIMNFRIIQASQIKLHTKKSNNILCGTKGVLDYESCLEGVNRQVKTFSTKTRSKLGKTELISKFT